MSIEEKIQKLEQEETELHKGLLRLKGLAEESEEDWQRYKKRINRKREIFFELRKLRNQS